MTWVPFVVYLIHFSAGQNHFLSYIYFVFVSSKASQSNSQVIRELKKINRTVLLSEEITGNQHIDLQLKTLEVRPFLVALGTGWVL